MTTAVYIWSRGCVSQVVPTAVGATAAGIFFCAGRDSRGPGGAVLLIFDLALKINSQSEAGPREWEPRGQKSFV